MRSAFSSLAVHPGDRIVHMAAVVEQRLLLFGHVEVVEQHALLAHRHHHIGGLDRLAVAAREHGFHKALSDRGLARRADRIARLLEAVAAHEMQGHDRVVDLERLVRLAERRRAVLHLERLPGVHERRLAATGIRVVAVGKDIGLAQRGEIGARIAGLRLGDPGFIACGRSRHGYGIRAGGSGKHGSERGHAQDMMELHRHLPTCDQPSQVRGNNQARRIAAMPIPAAIRSAPETRSVSRAKRSVANSTRTRAASAA